jgi:putative two-component system response regulator
VVSVRDSARQLILIIDDDAAARELARDSLAGLGCDIIEATDGIEGIVAARRHEPDLVLLDIQMPGIDGWTVCRRLKSLPRGRLTPVVVVSALDDTAARVLGLQAGADDILGKPYNLQELIERVQSLLEVRTFYGTLDDIDSFLLSLSFALDAKSGYSQRHSKRVAETAHALGSAAGVIGSALEDLRRGALVHDIGKIGVPDALLSKPDRLDPAEVEQMRAHATIGAGLIAPLAKADSLGPIVRHHHEHWDGLGYPDGLAGEQIPIGARIIAVCDAWDAMTSDRPYRTALSPLRARTVLREGSGTQWDPRLVDLFLESVIGSSPAALAASA